MLLLSKQPFHSGFPTATQQQYATPHHTTPHHTTPRHTEPSHTMPAHLTPYVNHDSLDAALSSYKSYESCKISHRVRRASVPCEEVFEVALLGVLLRTQEKHCNLGWRAWWGQGLEWQGYGRRWWGVGSGSDFASKKRTVHWRRGAGGVYSLSCIAVVLRQYQVCPRTPTMSGRRTSGLHRPARGGGSGYGGVSGNKLCQVSISSGAARSTKRGEISSAGT